MRDGQTKCLTHNRWYVDGFSCPECERDEVLERQTDYLEELASKQSNPEEIRHSHALRRSGRDMDLELRVEFVPAG